VLERLVRDSGESAQLFVRAGDARRCVDAAESDSELRTIVEVGATLPITAGSAGKVFMAWAPVEERSHLLELVEPLTASTPTGAALERQLAVARRRGWSHSAGERQPGVGSVSAPIFGPAQDLVAVVSISGPRSRITSRRASEYAQLVTAAARRIGDELRRAGA
jgi:DNA-binding IclR family transcriptional regulator